MIKIKWDYSVEYIDIHPNNIKEIESISSTREWWPHDKIFVEYQVICEIEHFQSGEVQLTIEYDHEKNKNLNYDDAMWGKSVLTFGSDNSHGKVTWTGRDNSDGNGDTEWSLVEFKTEKKNINVSRAERRQQKFRKELLDCESQCVVTGELTQTVLEAAHIISSKDGGPEIVENGIILRADIHRLYDANNFSIDLSGAVIDVNGVSSEYMSILEGAKIPRDTLLRVGEALRIKLDES